MQISKRNILITLITIFLVFGFSKAHKVKKYFIEERYRYFLSSLHITKPCYSPNQDLLAVMAQNAIDYKRSDTEVVKDSLSKLASESLDEGLKIPAITHHIYFTYDQEPIKLKDFFIEKMKANFGKLNELEQEWQHYIWTNKPEVFPKEIMEIKGVKLMNLAEFKDHALYSHLILAINKGNNLRAYFMEASDMLRLMVLQKFGGIYNDMDYEIYNASALFSLMKRFDFIGGREPMGEYSYYGNAFMVAKAHHPVIDEAVNKLISYDNNQAFQPEYLKRPCNLLEKLYFNSPPLLTVAYLSKNNLNGNSDIILPAWMVFNVEFARVKNGGCSYINMSQALFKQHNDNLKNLIDKFTAERKINAESALPIIGADMFCATWYENRK